MSEGPARFLPLAERLADAAGVIARRHFRTRLAIDTKADKTPVTIADREAETAMRALLAEAVPEHGILGEEHCAERLDADYVWVLDPIDGTQGFATGKPLFGILVALTHKGRPVLGVIDHPALGERWTGAEGVPTLYNGKPAERRTCDALAQAWMYATSPHMFDAETFPRFESLRKNCLRALYGADCYAYGLLASGHVDLVVEAALKPYDFCALVPVIAGAGGIVTDWDGQELSIASSGRVVAAGDARRHKEAVAILSA